MVDRGSGWRGVLGAMAIVTAVCHGAGAQSATASAMKAAFLLNFVKFATWPPDALAPQQPLTICVDGDAEVAGALRQMIGVQSVEYNQLTLEVVKNEGSLRHCHLLYVGGRALEPPMRWRDAIKGAAVLSVGDGGGFAAQGGVIELFVESGRMRFNVNLAAAQSARITLSSRLLSLAKIVRDDGHVQHD